MISGWSVQTPVGTTLTRETPRTAARSSHEICSSLRDAHATEQIPSTGRGERRLKDNPTAVLGDIIGWTGVGGVSCTETRAPRRVAKS